ncbi:MAG: GIY-YIG nuclease family protein [bacterium]|nr:GIY-YIG nuclease family protein [bacterium]
MYFVYILKSLRTGRYYVGCTDNIGRRVQEHNSGSSVYTKNKGPWGLVYKEAFSSLNNARVREQQIKSWKKRIAIEKLIQAPFV